MHAHDYTAVSEWMAEKVREGMRDGLRMHAYADRYADLTGARSVSLGYMAQYESERYASGCELLMGVNA